MTSQLILGNGQGLALASDSAATYGSRTYEDATKIRHLPDPHRVAILQADGVTLIGLPVGVLMEEWQQTLGDGQMTLPGYRDSFMSWLGYNLDKWTTEAEMDNQIYDCLVAELKDIRKLVEEACAAIPEEDHQDAALAAIQGRKESWVGMRVFDAALPGMADRILSRLGSRGEGWWTPESLLHSAFEGLPYSEQIDQTVHEIFRLMVGRDSWIPCPSGIELTFAGYGSGDLVPSVASVRLEGAIENHIARSSEESMRADRFGSGFALFKPIAQHRVIEMIIGAHNPALLKEAIRRSQEDHETSPPTEESAGVEGDSLVGPEAADHDPDHLREAMGVGYLAAVQRFGERVVEHAESLSDTFHSEKFMETIAILELPSLADTARALVAVEALSKDLKGEQPTVGGHIDLATLTLRDGFTWVSQQ